MNGTSQDFYQVDSYDYKEMLERMKKEFFMLYYEEGNDFVSYLFMDKDDYTPYFQCLIENPGTENQEHFYYIYSFPNDEKMNPPIPKLRVQINHPTELQAILDAFSKGELHG